MHGLWEQLAEIRNLTWYRVDIAKIEWGPVSIFAAEILTAAKHLQSTRGGRERRRKSRRMASAFALGAPRLHFYPSTLRKLSPLALLSHNRGFFSIKPALMYVSQVPRRALAVRAGGSDPVVGSDNGPSGETERQYDFDLFTIGAGSGGVRASRFAANYGAKVAVCELPFATISSDHAGGVGGT